MIVEQTPGGANKHVASNRAWAGIPILLWVLVILTLMALAWRRLDYGFLPPDDTLRHAAKVVNGKAWPEILVLRPEITLDHNRGWHWVLGRIHHVTITAWLWNSSREDGDDTKLKICPSRWPNTVGRTWKFNSVKMSGKRGIRPRRLG